MQIPLSRGLFAMIDDDDADLVAGHKWHAAAGGSTFYAVSEAGTAMHRLLLRPERREVVDHADGDGLNNRRSNIRVCSHAQNMRNRKASVGCASRFKGVRVGRNGRWRASITAHNQQIELGLFSTQEQAAHAYDRAARNFHGKFARTNEMLGLLPVRA